MTTENTAPLDLTPEAVFRFWRGLTDDAYTDEPSDVDAGCWNCRRSYGEHTDFACPTDDGKPLGDGFVLDTLWYLNADARKGGALEGRLIAAWNAYKHIPYADLPAYYDGHPDNPWSQWDAWNVMSDCYLQGDFDASVDMAAFKAAFEWVAGWKQYTETHGGRTFG